MISAISPFSIIMQSLYSKDVCVTKCKPISHTSLQDKAIHYLSLAIDIQIQGYEIPLSRLSYELKLLVLLLIGIIY